MNILRWTPGITRRIEFTFYRNWYVKMPELTSPYEFAMANIDGLTAANMINGYTFTNREMTIAFIQPTRVAYVRNQRFPGTMKSSQFVASPSFTSTTFLDWEQPQSYTTIKTIRFPYGMMTLDDSVAETDIAYTDDTVNHKWTIPSRLTQADMI